MPYYGATAEGATSAYNNQSIKLRDARASTRRCGATRSVLRRGRGLQLGAGEDNHDARRRQPRGAGAGTEPRCYSHLRGRTPPVLGVEGSGWGRSPSRGSGCRTRVGKKNLRLRCVLGRPTAPQATCKKHAHQLDHTTPFRAYTVPGSRCLLPSAPLPVARSAEESVLSSRLHLASRSAARYESLLLRCPFLWTPRSGCLQHLEWPARVLGISPTSSLLWFSCGIVFVLDYSSTQVPAMWRVRLCRRPATLNYGPNYGCGR
jgi:hypothetical protein